MALLTEHAELDELGGGAYRQEIAVKRIAYWDAGSLVRSVNDFVDGDASWPHVVAQASQPLYTAADGMRRFHPTREADRYLEIGPPYIKPSTTWTKVNIGTATRTANRLAWTTTNANVYIDHGGHFVKMGILLKNGWVPPNNQVAFPVGLSGLTRSGGNILRDGVVVAHLTPPTIHDYDNPDGATLPIDWQFVNVSGQAYVLFTLPSLTGMSRPLVDPTLTLQPDATDGVDTLIRGAPNDNTNYGTNTAIDIKYDTVSPSNWRVGLIKFNLSTLPVDATVTSAIISGTWSGGYNAAVTVRLYKCLRAWTEAGATWNKYDGADSWGTGGCRNSTTDYDGTTILGESTLSSDPGAGTLISYSDLNMSALVQSLAGGTLNIVGHSISNQANWSIASSDNATAGYRPKLVVDYELPAGWGIFRPDASPIFGGVVVS